MVVSTAGISKLQTHPLVTEGAQHKETRNR
jgi:hypothetical protein